ncbi:hypothetical protein D6779_09620 [Candidatus Parcubacteria bacterium]|nr:MAG: hypothetical protein D6779_09620 [Candidatus Parcubacteria bacterium]
MIRVDKRQVARLANEAVKAVRRSLKSDLERRVLDTLVQKHGSVEALRRVLRGREALKSLDEVRCIAYHLK